MLILQLTEVLRYEEWLAHLIIAVFFIEKGQTMHRVKLLRAIIHQADKRSKL